jgi:hypothetical protein
MLAFYPYNCYNFQLFVLNPVSKYFRCENIILTRFETGCSISFTITGKTKRWKNEKIEKRVAVDGMQ